MTHQLGRFLVIAGVVLVALGLLVMAGARWSFGGLGRLPGDIGYRGKNVQFYFPVATCILASLAMTLLLWLISLFGRK
jgi:hypothetical protein